MNQETGGGGGRFQCSITPCLFQDSLKDNTSSEISKPTHNYCLFRLGGGVGK